MFRPTDIDPRTEGVIYMQIHMGYGVIMGMEFSPVKLWLAILSIITAKITSSSNTKYPYYVTYLASVILFTVSVGIHECFSLTLYLLNQ